MGQSAEVEQPTRKRTDDDQATLYDCTDLDLNQLLESSNPVLLAQVGRLRERAEAERRGAVAHAAFSNAFNGVLTAAIER